MLLTIHASHRGLEATVCIRDEPGIYLVDLAALVRLTSSLFSSFYLSPVELP